MNLQAFWLRIKARLPVIYPAVLGVALLAVFLQGMKITTASTDMPSFRNRSDFDDYFQAAIKLSKGEDPYHIEKIEDLKEEWEASGAKDPAELMRLLSGLKGVGTYLYAPFTAFLLTPLAPLSYRAASSVFQALSFAALLLFCFLMYRMGRTDRARFFAAAALACLLCLRFLIENAGNGNVGFFLLLLVLAGLSFSFSDRPFLMLLGGFLLGLATVMKVTPVVFGIVLLGGRRWTALAGAAVGALFALLSPALLLGWDRNLELLGNWNTLLLSSYQKNSFVRAWANNQSLAGALGKLFVPNSDMKQAAVGLPIVSLAPAGVYMLGQGVRFVNLALLGLAGVLGLLTAVKQPLTRSDLFERIRGFDIVMLSALVSLIVSGVSWYHAYSLLLLPVWLFLRIRPEWTGMTRGEKSVIVIVGFFGLGTLILSWHLRDVLAMYSVLVWLALAVIGWLSLRIVRSLFAAQVSG
ncbi:MAG: DUF2029 domain-containing protein [Spirochaetia bacterium]|nr:DUF2029 domain-containing protein [Spirochaetia bacterium]